jgi:hypothetical protein
VGDGPAAGLTRWACNTTRRSRLLPPRPREG